MGLMMTRMKKWQICQGLRLSHQKIILPLRNLVTHFLKRTSPRPQLNLDMSLCNQELSQPASNCSASHAQPDKEEKNISSSLHRGMNIAMDTHVKHQYQIPVPTSPQYRKVLTPSNQQSLLLHHLLHCPVCLRLVLRNLP